MRTKTYKVYKFDELSDEAKNVAIFNQIKFEIETMGDDSPYQSQAKKMDEMQTPWFLAETIWDECKDSIIETIRVNEYEFKGNGDID